MLGRQHARAVPPAVAAALLTAAGSGCGPGLEKLAAEGTGDLSYSLERRVAPDAGLVEACGDGEIRDDERLLRRPYLQRVDGSGASIVFTAPPGAAINVVLTLPDGSPVASTEAAMDVHIGSGEVQYEARFESLTPASIYCYELEGIAERAGFVTAPPAPAFAPRGAGDGRIAPDDEGAVRFIVFGDSGSGSAKQYALAEQMATVPFDLILHTGDIAYDDGTQRELDAHYFDVYAPLLRSFPAFPVTGNHDYRTEDAAPYRRSFVLPPNGGEAGRERWFSFDWGPVHFVALDTEKTGATQAAWLERDLRENQLPWVIVYAHRPPYTSGRHGPDADMREVIVPILRRHRVELVLTGHDHHYQRFGPIDGITYVVTGGGGGPLRRVQPDWLTAYAETVFHFVHVEVGSDELLLHAIDGVGREFDSARVERRD